jgi:hypothetical protein
MAKLYTSAFCIANAICEAEDVAAEAEAGLLELLDRRDSSRPRSRQRKSSGALKSRLAIEINSYMIEANII